MTEGKGTCREPDALTLYIEIDVARYIVIDKWQSHKVLPSLLAWAPTERKKVQSHILTFRWKGKIISIGFGVSLPCWVTASEGSDGGTRVWTFALSKEKSKWVFRRKAWRGWAWEYSIFKSKGKKHYKCHCLQGAYEKTLRVDMEGRRFTTGKEYLREMSADECLSWQFTQVWEGMWEDWLEGKEWT